MICKHLHDGTCEVATKLCGFTAETTDKTCQACSKQINPQQKNLVTLGLAALAITKNGKTLSDYSQIQEEIRNNLPVDQGPGTELKKLISWFYSPSKKKCKCQTRIAKMNAWGPDKCAENIDTIMRWLRHSAQMNSVIFIEPAVRILVWIAIRRSRKNV